MWNMNFYTTRVGCHMIGKLHTETTHFFQGTHGFHVRCWNDVRYGMNYVMLTTGRRISISSRDLLIVPRLSLHPWQWPGTGRSMDDPTDFRRLSRPFDAFRDDEIAIKYLSAVWRISHVHIHARKLITERLMSDGSGNGRCIGWWLGRATHTRSSYTI